MQPGSGDRALPRRTVGRRRSGGQCLQGKGRAHICGTDRCRSVSAGASAAWPAGHHHHPHPCSHRHPRPPFSQSAAGPIPSSRRSRRILVPGASQRLSSAGGFRQPGPAPLWAGKGFARRGGRGEGKGGSILASRRNPVMCCVRRLGRLVIGRERKRRRLRCFARRFPPRAT